jgi:hypothetical protein
MREAPLFTLLAPKADYFSHSHQRSANIPEARPLHPSGQLERRREANNPEMASAKF